MKDSDVQGSDARGSDRPARDEHAAGAEYDPEYSEGGDPVCWAHLVCPDCGAIESEGHRPGCESARPVPVQLPNLARPDSPEQR